MLAHGHVEKVSTLWCGHVGRNERNGGTGSCETRAKNNGGA